jgi:ABC-2 type transport system ATP-binding protein
VLPDPNPVLALRDVTVEFGRLKALDQVSFHVPRASITGLIGRNGAGKSTSIRCLAGLILPNDSVSEIRIFGRSPAADREQVMRNVGFLLSEPALFAYLTPRETLGYLGRAYGLSTPDSRARADELIHFFDLEAAADRLVDNFSTGMKKRLGLAAALIHAPDLLVLDEPFESLDPLMVRSVKRLLRGYSANGGTVLLSSHLIDAVEEICDRVVILEQGRVVASGGSAEVRAKIAERLPEATLEDLYASLVPEGELPALGWLTGSTPPQLGETAGEGEA